MNNYRDKFKLFGEEPFSNYVSRKLHSIENSIKQISDNEILAQAQTLEELAKKMATGNCLAEVEIEFDGKRIEVEPFMGESSVFDRLMNEYKMVKRGFVRYKFPVRSGVGLLKFSLGTNPDRMRRLVHVIDNEKLVFDYDTGYASLNFSETIKGNIRRDALLLKDEVLQECGFMNEAVKKYNAHLEEFVLPRLQQRLVAAQKAQHNLKDLNPFDPSN